MNIYYVYIMASKRNGALYVGVTNDIKRRVYEHKNKIIPKIFTQRYNISILVYYEEHGGIVEAIHREKCLKKWNRWWKLKLIEEINPTWRDLYSDFCTLVTLADAGV